MSNINLKLEVDFNSAEAEQKIIKAFEEVLFDFMIAVEGQAKRKAPVLTGRLRNGIHVFPRKPAKHIIVSDDVEYGVYQEFGTSRAKAQPFMRPGLNSAFKKDLPLILKKHNLK